MTLRSSSWLTDVLSPHERHVHHLKKTLAKCKTPYQQALIAETYAFGRCLVLDGEIQSAERDEFIYHESLVHPAMVLHPSPKDVLILGGGEGATVRETLRHRKVQTVTMVDIDGDVVALCRQYLSRWHRGTLENPKVRVIIGDGGAFMRETDRQFDVILSDLPTPTGPGPLDRLYSRSFYKEILKHLTPHGILAVQAGSGNFGQMEFHKKLYKCLREFFKIVRPYYAFIPSFDVPWAFLVATNRQDPRRLSAAHVNRRLGTFGRLLKFYDGETHEGLFRIPKYYRAALT